MKAKIFTIVAAAATLIAGCASAAILTSVEPGSQQVGAWGNAAATQNFLVSFTLAQETQISGFNLWADTTYGNIGQAVTVKVRADAGADTPSTSNLYEFSSVIDSSTVVDSAFHVRKVGADFAPLTLSAGTYWIGMSGANSELSWVSWNLQGNIRPPGQWQLANETLITRPNVFNLGFEVLGSPVTAGVPEPATWALMIGGFGLAGVVLRRRPAVVAT